MAAFGKTWLAYAILVLETEVSKKLTLKVRKRKRIQSRDFFLFLLHHLHSRPFSVIVSAIEPHNYKLFFYFQQKKMKIPAVLEAIEISAEKARNLIK